MTTQKDNPHITRKLTFQPELHRLVRSGLNPTGVKCVTRRMSAQCQVGDVVAMTTGWRTYKGLDDAKPRKIDESVKIAWESDSHDQFMSGHAVFSPGKLRQARFFPRHLYHLAPLAIITDVRQEPVQAINEDDAILEGMQPTDEQRKHAWAPHYDAFASTWVRLHGIESWEKNDLVYRIAWEPITDAEARARWERGSK